MRSELPTTPARTEMATRKKVSVCAVAQRAERARQGEPGGINPRTGGRACNDQQRPKSVDAVTYLFVYQITYL